MKNLARPLIALAIVVAACVLSARFSEHHEHADPFIALYSHLVPAPLVHPDAHAPASDPKKPVA